ncbi:MAG: hypothetical protein F2903_07360 [Actinobacteria bacterium]|uniref:Unannotated protein n=1 Tax=freshwater metagenome TaxID=449393 RepID=A0A6J7RKD8_9ZZZZ|nr:hypothetical protein [Actinomycetota bacterium]MSX10725.1 hypothetical protein [Actinomycetota bacterium]MSX68092.1 hypothetical protein [Actinomycetota bacterium]
MTLPESDDAMIRRVLWSLPTGLYVLGSVVDEVQGPWNLMTINLVTQVATTPRILGVSLESDSRSLEYVRHSGKAALSILAREDRAVVRRFVKAVEDVEIDTEGRPTRLSGVEVELTPLGVPVLSQAVAWLDLKVVTSTEFESHTMVFLAVAGARAIPELLEGSASERSVEILRMEDTRMNYGG